jgi:hypothetical protein
MVKLMVQIRSPIVPQKVLWGWMTGKQISIRKI